MTKAEGVWLWLSMTGGVGARTAHRLVTFFGSEEAVWSATPQQLERAAGVSLAQELAGSRSGDAINAHVRDCRRAGITPLTPASPGYPAGLLDLCDPPCVLYAKGDLSLLERDGITIVGTRRHTRYGERITAQLSRELAQAGLVVVSGLAEGLDAVAHRAALDAGGGTIAVLGNGVDVYYPAVNAALQDDIARCGLLLSESPPGKRANKGSFPMRNRVLAALTRATLVTGSRGEVRRAADRGVCGGLRTRAVRRPGQYRFAGQLRHQPPAAHQRRGGAGNIRRTRSPGPCRAGGAACAALDKAG